MLDKLRSWQHYDKVLHAAVGFGIGLGASALAGAGFGLVAVIAAGVGKEIYDARHRNRHTPDVWDAVVTVAAGVPGIFVGSWLWLF